MAEQMYGQLFTYTTKLNKCKLSFHLLDEILTNYINIEYKINLRNLHLRQIQFILGLNLLFTTFQSCVFTPTYMNFLTFPSLALTSESARKHGGIPPPTTTTTCCAKCFPCNSAELLAEETFQDSSLY